jgi:hypothetical protein
MKTKREMPLGEALEEISTAAQAIKSGSVLVADREIALDEPVTLEIETESSKKSAELEFEIKWPAEKSKAGGNGAKGGGRWPWLLVAAMGIAAGAAAFVVTRKRLSSEVADVEGEEFEGPYSTV